MAGNKEEPGYVETPIEPTPTVSIKMTALADSIRSKTGGTELLTIDGMTEAIDTVYEAGKTAEWNSLWDDIQDKGNRTNYTSSSGFRSWTDASFRPKYDFKPSGTAANLFNTFQWFLVIL